MKKKHIAVYDYGSGAVWLLIYARSEEEISIKYPELRVIKSSPEWMQGEQLRLTESVMTFDIDEPPKGWLLELVRAREPEK